MEFGNYADYRKLIPNYPKLFFTTFEKPKYYENIPDSYNIQWDDPHKFIPDKYLSNFNQRMFVNFIHRECFNSCVNYSSNLSNEETICYENCKNKHLSSLETFKNILLERRKWKGWKNFVALKEYSRIPEEMGTDFPTDPQRRHEIYDKQEETFMLKQKIGLREALNSEFSTDEKQTIFDVYLNQENPPLYSKAGLEIKAKEREDKYNEYKELNEKYGSQVADLLKQKVNIKNWKDVPGEDWTPEEADSSETIPFSEQNPNDDSI